MNSTPKGKNKFSSAELRKIRELIVQKCNASRSEQKSIRTTLRNMKFHIKDFTEDIRFVEEFDQLIKDGKIICIDKSSTSSVKVMNSESNMNQISLKISAEKEYIKKGLNAITGDMPRILILGTLPGDESLQKQEYYAKTGNRFWEIIYSLYNEYIIPTTYEKRRDFLNSHNIAIWDVLSTAVRIGSLDSNIEQDMPNDIPTFLKEYPTIEVIAFNGKKAKEKFEKHFPQLLTNKKLKLLTLLSSSSANRKFSLVEMKEDWKKLLK